MTPGRVPWRTSHSGPFVRRFPESPERKEDVMADSGEVLDPAKLADLNRVLDT